ncbi:MAG: hypothetical protein LBR39_00080 [Coriobacteriales bacterium]|nr:hypothetical protein [Coriobacteriales bacterium]
MDKNMTVSTYAFLGPEGTYSHQAALSFAAAGAAPAAAAADATAATQPAHDVPAAPAAPAATQPAPDVPAPGASPADVELIECASIAEIFDLVDRGRTNFGVVPIENALEGSVNETLDAFAFTSGAQIRAEIVVDIHHSLIAAPGVELADVRTIASHPQAIGQSRRWLQRHLPQAATLATTSTAEAVRMAITASLATSAQPGQLAPALPGPADPAVAPSTTAAIGAPLAAELFGGNVLAEQIEDHFGNQTRFVLIGPDPLPTPSDTSGYKTSLALFMKEDRPGTLLMILEEFAYAGLNLSKIQSRPTKRALGDYMFWIDIDGHTDDIHVKTALDCLRLKLREVKTLGSYPAA